MTYVGRRKPLMSKKTYHCFIDSKGEERNWPSKMSGLFIGYTYLGEKKGDSVLLDRRPELTNDDPIDNPEWVAKDELVCAYLDKKRKDQIAEKKILKLERKAVQIAIDAMVPLLRGLDYTDRMELAKHLVEKAGRNLK